MNHYHCPQCGEHVAADEDGCCTTCGADCLVEPCRARARVVKVPACRIWKTSKKAKAKK